MTRVRGLICIIIFAVELTIAFGYAYADAAVSDTSEIRLDVVEVLVSRLTVKVSTSTPVQVMTTQQLSKLGVADVADAVRRFAGVSVKDYGGLGGLKTVSVRNMGASHTAVSYDGAPLSNCQGGQIDIGQFSLDNTSSLTMAIGGDADILQPARLYCSAAVLSIKSQAPVFKPNTNYAFRIKAQAGDWGFVNPYFRWWQRYGKKVSTSLSGGYLHSDGNYPFAMANGVKTGKQKRLNSAVTTWRGEANVWAELNDRQSLTAKLYWYDSKRGLPGPVIFDNPVSTEKLTERTVFAQSTYRNNISERINFQCLGKFTYGYSLDHEQNPKYAEGVYEARHTQREYYLSASGFYRPWRAFTVAISQDGIYNTLSSTMPDCPYPKRISSLSALAAKFQTSGVNLFANLTATYVKERVASGKAPSDLFRLNPSASFSIRLLSQSELYLRGMYKSTFRTPTFNDLYYDRNGNRNIKPEKADEFNFGLTFNQSFSAILDYVAVTVDGYYNRVTDKIVAIPTTHNWRMMNFGKAQITGLDITVSSGVSMDKNLRIGLSGSYTLQRALDVTDKTAKSYKAQLPYTPTHSGNVGLTLTTPWLEVGYSGVGVGARYSMKQNTPEYKIDGYYEQTLSISRGFEIGKNISLKLSGEILNLTNVQYEVIKYYPMPGRTWRLTACVDF